MQDIAQTIARLYFDPSKPNEIISVDIKKVAKFADVSENEVTIKLDYMEDEMYILLLDSNKNVFDIILISRGVDYFNQLIKK